MAVEGGGGRKKGAGPRVDHMAMTKIHTRHDSFFFAYRQTDGRTDKPIEQGRQKGATIITGAFFYRQER